MLRNILATLSFVISISLTGSTFENMEIDPRSGHNEFKVYGSKGQQKDTDKRLAAVSKIRETHLRVERVAFPACNSMMSTLGDLTGNGYCEGIARAQERNCPRGISLGYVTNPQSGEENLEQTRLWPLECTAGTGPGAVLTAEMISQEFKILSAVLTAEMISQEFKILPIKGSGLKYRPEEISPIINLPFIPFTDSTPQLLNTTILGTPILIEATPISFTWDYGDDSKPLTTTDPNKQLYPNHSYQHTYTRTGEVTVTLQTTWQGRYQLPGSPWQTIPGQATTFETSPTITIKESRPVNIN